MAEAEYALLLSLKVKQYDEWMYKYPALETLQKKKNNPNNKKPYRLQSSQLKISKVFICNKIIYSMNNEKMLPNRCHVLNKFVWSRHKL